MYNQKNNKPNKVIDINKDKIMNYKMNIRGMEEEYECNFKIMNKI